MDSVSKAFAPATVANLGPGFDVIGFALAGVGDTVELRRRPDYGVSLAEVVGDEGRLPLEPERNVASAVAARVLEAAGADFGADLRLEKGLPLASGLGSSAASAVAGAWAANGLLDGLFDMGQLLEFCRFGEKLACGTGHADNIAPSLYGGITMLRRSDCGEEVVRLQPAAAWHVAVVHPDFQLPTEKARAALPESVSLERHVASLSNAASLVAALSAGDLSLCGRSIMSDKVVEPVRGKLIPHYEPVRQAGLAAGAVAVVVSGAGPSLVALTDSRDSAGRIGSEMARIWKKNGLATDILVSPVGARGAHTVNDKY